MAADGLAWTLALSRYLAAPAIASGGSYTFAVPSPFSSVATPATAWLAAWIGAPPQVLPDAPSMPICIGPAAPKPFWPLRTPGRLVWPLLLSTVPMPARIVHGTPYCCPTFLYQDRKFDGIDLALAPAGGCPAMPVCCPEQPALAAKNAFVPTRMGTASRPRPTTARSPMMPTTRIRGSRCCLVVLCWVSVRIRSLFVMTDPHWPARCYRPASLCPIR